MVSIHFKPDELAALMNYCRTQMALIDAVSLREGRKRNFDELTKHLFWDALYVKLEAVFKTPTCCWCDQRAWDLDDSDTIPDLTGHPHLHLPPTWN